MSTDEKSQTKTPELSEEGKAEVQRMQDTYDDERPTVALPGTGNTITGVAINEWLDEVAALPKIDLAARGLTGAQLVREAREESGSTDDK